MVVETERTLRRLFAERILLLDGAMGTMIQSLKLDEKDFRGKRFADHPNLVYTDGNEWVLYRLGSVVGRVVRATGDVTTDGATTYADAECIALEGLLEKGGRFDELRELLQSRLAHTIDPRELVRLNARLGRVLYVMLKRA